MCYSAQVIAEYKAYVRLFGARMDLKEFYHLFWSRAQGADIAGIPRAMEEVFADPQSEEEREIKALIDKYRTRRGQEWTELLFTQKTRLSAATRKLSKKPTKAAEKEFGVATRRVAQIEGWLNDLRRIQPADRDARIFPDHYAPVMISRGGEKMVVPMRYHCRPAGKPAWHDDKFPGTFNARRSSLEGYWSGQFGHTHGVALWTSFYENVLRHQAEGRPLAPGEEETKVVIKFEPNTHAQMMVACVWSHWKGLNGEPDLYSFAAVTDEPPPEISAAGHDRCIIPLKPHHIDAWLNPDPRDRASQYAILDDRERPYYEHRIALAA